MHHLPKAMQYRQVTRAIFFTKLGEGRMSQIHNLTPNFTVVAFKMWAYRRRNHQNWYFLVYIFPKGVYPLKRFLQNLAWGSDSQARTLLSSLTIVTIKIWAHSPQDR